MIKLIASDLDDTLLDRNAQLTTKNKEAICQAIEAGILFTIATGRMFQATAPFAKSLGLGAEVPLICYNGAMIRRLSGEILYEQPLSAEISQVIVEHGQRRGWTINAYFDDELYVSTLNKEAQDYADRVRVGVTPVGSLLEFIEDGNKRLSKLMIIGEPSETMERIEELRPLVGENVHLVRSRPRYIEITNAQAHKGNALLWLAQSLGIGAHEVMAIGDSQNDLTMIEMAGVGVAVANAAREIQALAQHVVATNQDNGVAQAIAEFALG
ncbi:MAG: Cof-type HAD-IIB family hydrolase [Limnochordia bacterium]|jgi:Cof subfamily protein (haloacid dehalogenase superfamily)|nr:Cof-type HAD-IIB family hydrolase [Limnochordia bacterium]